MKTNNAMSKTTATVEGLEIIVTHTFHAPRELVFKAWTEPKHLPQWWGPQGFTTTVHDIDIKPGGVWRYVMHGPDGTDYENKVTFLEIDAPERLAYIQGDSQGERFRVSVTFDQQDLITKLTMRMLFKTVGELDQVVKEFGAIEGARSTLNRLDQHLPNITLSSALGREFKVERIFDAPRELVFKAFSEAGHLKEWWGPRGWVLTVCDIDFHPGGSWHYCMKCVDKSLTDFYGFESWGKAIYQEIIEGEKIVYIDYFSDAEGKESNEMPACEITLNFIECEGKTMVVSQSQFASAEALKTVVEMGMEKGITETWDRLSEHLQSCK